MLRELFRTHSDTVEVIDCLYGIAPPPAKAVTARTKAIAKIKEQYAGKLRCDKSMPRLRKPI
jgi:hypothetical protein